MIRVHAVKYGETYCDVTSEGHADYSEAGSDIVCSAVSVLMINTANALEKFTDDLDRVDEKEDGGYLRIVLKKPASEKGTLLMNTLILGLQSVRRTYGKQFLNITVTKQKPAEIKGGVLK